MIINIITVATCFFMLIFFRRMDRANVRMHKLKLYSDRINSDFQKMTERENRKIQQNITEMDILLKKSSAMAKKLGESVTEIESRMEGLEVEKKTLRKVDEELRIISGAAQDVNKQIDYIAKAKSDFSDLSRSVGLLHENIESISGEMNENLQNFEARLQERSQEISEKFYSQAKEMQEELRKRQGEMGQASHDHMNQLAEEFTNNISTLERRVSESENILVDNFKVRISPLIKTVESAESLNRELNNLQETFAIMENNFLDEFKSKTDEMKSGVDRDFQDMKGQISEVKQNIEDSRSDLIKSFGEEVSKVRTELDNFDIHAITKKDEIVKEARLEAKNISKRIEDFEERFLDLESRMVDTAEKKIDGIDTEYKKAENKINNMLKQLNDEEDRMGENFKLFENQLNNLHGEIMKYEQNHNVFGRADELMKKVDEFEKFASQLNQIKDIKKTADREIRDFLSKKEKLIDVEKEINILLEANDEAISKTASIFKNMPKVDSVKEQVELLSQTYESLEGKIATLTQNEAKISKNLDSVQKTDIMMKSIDDRLNSSEAILEKYYGKLENMGNHVRQIEEETLLLKTKEKDIREVRERLDYIDSMSEVIDERVKQIQAMLSKVEGMRQEIDRSDSKLQEMYNATDQKMRELSDFIQAVDNNSPIVKQVKGNGGLSGKNLNDSMVRTVRELSDKGWDPEAISRKLMVDENSIRFIINTTSL